MTWLAILKAVLTMASALTSWMQERRLVDSGRAQVISENLRCALDEIGKANVARDAVRRDVERDPAKVRDDDSFKRPD